ncbi:MAG: hypothetical protein GTN73_09495 [Candidatus Aminicenantes bacterium]|nr:hypothetical protein [Candidatus Aminicenantes bacterium]
MKKIYKPIITFLILLNISLSASLTCFSQDEKEKKGTLNPKKISSLQKSLLIPGWGQIAEKRYLEGILFLSAEIFCFYKIFSYNHKGNDYYNLYKRADNVSDATKYRDLTEKFDTKRNRFILAAASVWIINLIDIYIIVKKKDEKERNLRLKFKFNENKDLAFTISYSF